MTRTKTVYGHPRSKVMVPIDSSWSISYSAFIDPIVVSVTVFEIFNISLKLFFNRTQAYRCAKPEVN